MGTSDNNERKKRESGYNSRGRFEQWTKNSSCEANVLSSVLGTPMDIPAKDLNLTPTRGQSPFAIARGRLFERNLFKDNAVIFLNDLMKHDLIPDSSNCKFVDLRQKKDGGRCRNIDESMDKTHSLFKSLQDTGENDIVVAGPVVKIPGSEILLPEALLIIDVLVVKKYPDTYECTIGEVKTYPDRSGYTDNGNLATARAQAGMYVHALECVIQELQVQDILTVNKFGFLVLSKPGSLLPSIRVNEDLRYMAKRTRSGFEKLRKIADQFPQTINDQSSSELIQKADKNYRDDCLKFCDLAPHCREKAEEAGLPSILGHQMEQYTHGLNLHDILELIEEKRLPKNQAEEEFLQRYISSGGMGKAVSE